MTFADKAITFNEQLRYTGEPLPSGIRIMNPFQESGEAMRVANTFYRKYYNDVRPRHIILGINPGRLGAGLTGIPFTDPKRLMKECNIDYKGKITHEPSSVFVYEVIQAYGGVEAFYKDFYINSPCPLGFTSVASSGKEKNYNYYDSKELAAAVRGFMVDSLGKLVSLGVETRTCFCFGAGKNEKYLRQLNEQYGFFDEIVPLEHPRFIMQYKSANKTYYIDKYLNAFAAVRYAARVS